MANSSYDYLINMHLNLPPYNQMIFSDKLTTIKQHCGIPVNYISKYDTSEKNVPEECDVSNNISEMELKLLKYQSIQTISEEESVFSGSEEFYVDKWKNRNPYRKMASEEAETLIKSKLRIIHRDKSQINDSELSEDLFL